MLVPVFSTLGEELDGPLVTLWDTSSEAIRKTERGLCASMSLKSGLLKPFGCVLMALFASLTLMVAIPKEMLCIRVPLGSTLVVQLKCSLVAL